MPAPREPPRWRSCFDWHNFLDAKEQTLSDAFQ